MIKKLIEIHEELKLTEEQNLLEVLDLANVEGYDYRQTDHDARQTEYTFKTDDKLNVKVYFQYTDTKFYKLPEFLQKVPMTTNVSYLVNGTHDQYTKMEMPAFFKILKTVLECIKEFTRKNNPDIMVFAGTNKNGGMTPDPQKNKIYELLLRNNLPPNYNKTNVEVFGLTGVVAYRKDLK
jgi:hypothetical protein